MPKCWKCGKKGFFLQLNFDGICLDCFIAKEEEKEARRQRIQRKKTEKLQKFRTEVFPITTSIKEVQDIWGSNDCNHDDVEQLHRQQRARLTTPILLEKDSGFFLSSCSDNLYHCCLDYCTCEDYINRSLPCKHMYRLFYELTIGTPIAENIKNVDDTLAISFYKLPPEAQLEWVNHCRWYADCDLRTFKKSNNLCMLLEENLLIEIGTPNYEMLLHEKTKDQLILSLAKRGISGYRPSWSKVKLIDWIIQEQQTFLSKEFKQFISVGISPAAQKWASGINAVSHERYSTTAKPFGDTYIFI